MHQHHANERKIGQEETDNHGRFAAHPVGEQAHRDAQQERGKRGRGIDQPQEIPAISGRNDIKVEKQAPAAEEQPIQEERQQEQPGRAA